MAARKAAAKATPERNDRRGSKKGQKGSGQQPFEATDEQRSKVKMLVAVGTPQEIIAQMLGFSVDTLTRHFRHELDIGKAEANARIAGVLFNKAMKGDTTAAIFWMKTQGRWSEKVDMQHSGPDGGAIPIGVTLDDVMKARKGIVDEC